MASILNSVFAVREGLIDTGRFRSLTRPGRSISAAECGLLVLLGLVAAGLCGLRLNLAIPGHNIIRVVFPMALGLALVPRRGAASIMGLSGSAGAAALVLGGSPGLGAGAATSLVLTGFLLDLALVKARSGPSVYVRLVLAGLAANLAAFLVRGGGKALGAGSPGHMPAETWWLKAPVTYAICGALAGLLGAAVWFRFAARPKPPADREAPA